MENLLLSSQGTVKLCDFGSATTISHFPDYSWSAQQRALVEEEVRRAARVSPRGGVWECRARWEAQCRPPAARSSRVTGGSRSHTVQVVHLQCGGFRSGHPRTPLGAACLASPGPWASLPQRSTGAAHFWGCRSCRCPWLALGVVHVCAQPRPTSEPVPQWGAGVTPRTCPRFPCPAAATALSTVPTEPAAVGLGLVCLPRAEAPVCHGSRPVCWGLGLCPSSRY